MNEQFSLEEFLDPCILEWMDIDSLMDSEHAATVTHHSGKKQGECRQMYHRLET